ncbi:MAG: ATP-binding protein [Candidatus Thiodiazotropha sp.]
MGNSDTKITISDNSVMVDDSAESNRNPIKGEVSGSFLMGLVNSFYNLRVLPQGGFSLNLADIDPQQWYPYSMLMDTLHEIQRKLPAAPHLFFRAGMHFLRIWYETGPGKQMIHSTMDWLRAHDENGGYSSVVRGGSRDDIGWSLLQSLDEEKGIAIYENVMPLLPEYTRGVFYGGCMIFDDIDYVDVEESHEPYPSNPLFTRTIITVHFRLKNRDCSRDLDQYISSFRQGDSPTLSPGEIESLLWRHKGQLIRSKLDAAYFGDINNILADAIIEGQQITENLVRAKQQADAANQAKSVFLANMSHELRTPLSAILGYSQLMQRDRSLIPKHHKYLDTIRNGGEHLLALINDVLAISKIEAGQTTIESKTFDLHAMLNDLVLMFENGMSSKGLLFEVIGINDVPQYVKADEKKLHQALGNILSNSLKFTEQGGVTMRASVEDRAADVMRLKIEVEDTGVGIAKDEIDKVFDYFEQTTSGKSAQSGSGLGLALSRDITRMMGGDITVSSKEGKGSTFYLSLDIKEGKESDIVNDVAKPRVIGLAPGQSVPRVLVVEDGEASRTLLVTILQTVGFDVHAAANGKEAVDIFNQWQPHFIWMDIRMPVMDGLEATKHIKATEVGASTVITALTAHALEEEKESILSAGCDDFVRKPFHEQEIFDVMQKYLGLKYVYEDQKQESEQAKSKVDINPAELTDIPADILSQLYQAAFKLNEQQSLALIEKIKPINPHIANEMALMVRNFAYDTLQALTKKYEKS